MAYGMNAGVPINPAKDIGPRIFVGMLYGNQVFRWTCQKTQMIDHFEILAITRITGWSPFSVVCWEEFQVRGSTCSR